MNCLASCRMCDAGRHSPPGRVVLWYFDLATLGIARRLYSEARLLKSRPHKTPLISKQNSTTTLRRPDMAKPRAQLRQAEQPVVYQEDVKEEDAEETLDESGDPLEESGRTMDTSDEEIEDSVADDIARFEDSFTGINKRYRLINRIGEGESVRLMQRGVLRLITFSQVHSRLYTRPRTWSTTNSRTDGT